MLFDWICLSVMLFAFYLRLVTLSNVRKCHKAMRAALLATLTAYRCASSVSASTSCTSRAASAAAFAASTARPEPLLLIFICSIICSDNG